MRTMLQITKIQVGGDGVASGVGAVGVGVMGTWGWGETQPASRRAGLCLWIGMQRLPSAVFQSACVMVALDGNTLRSSCCLPHAHKWTKLGAGRRGKGLRGLRADPATHGTGLIECSTVFAGAEVGHVESLTSRRRRSLTRYCIREEESYDGNGAQQS